MNLFVLVKLETTLQYFCSNRECREQVLAISLKQEIEKVHYQQRMCVYQNDAPIVGVGNK